MTALLALIAMWMPFKAIAGTRISWSGSPQRVAIIFDNVITDDADWLWNQLRVSPVQSGVTLRKTMHLTLDGASWAVMCSRGGGGATPLRPTCALNLGTMGKDQGELNVTYDPRFSQFFFEATEISAAELNSPDGRLRICLNCGQPSVHFRWSNSPLP